MFSRYTVNDSTYPRNQRSKGLERLSELADFITCARFAVERSARKREVLSDQSTRKAIKPWKLRDEWRAFCGRCSELSVGCRLVLRNREASLNS